MESFYGWIRNIVCYLIFITMITNLLPSGKYEKYLRLFSGCILILLVLQPLTGSFRLEEQITALFHSFSFENDVGELSRGFDEMEKKRISVLIGQYEQTAAGDIRRLAAMEGLNAMEVSVQIAEDQSSPDFGKLKKVTVVLAGQEGDSEDAMDGGQKKAPEPAVQKVDVVDPVNIRVELGDSGKEEKRQSDGRGEPGGAASSDGGAGSDGGADSDGGAGSDGGSGSDGGGGSDGGAGSNREALRQPDGSQAVTEKGKDERQSAEAGAEKLRRQISGCYQVEAQNVEIKLEND